MERHINRVIFTNIEQVFIMNHEIKIWEIENAINKNESITIHYMPKDGTITKRIILPESMQKTRNDYLITAYCKLRNDTRNFMLSRILKIETVGIVKNVSNDIAPIIFLDANDRLTELQKMKENILSDPKSRGNSSGEVYSSTVLKQIKEINAEIRAIGVSV